MPLLCHGQWYSSSRLFPACCNFGKEECRLHPLLVTSGVTVQLPVGELYFCTVARGFLFSDAGKGKLGAASSEDGGEKRRATEQLGALFFSVNNFTATNGHSCLE